MIEFFLHKELINRNINKAQLSTMTGIRRDTITDIVNGDIKRIPVDALDKICYALGCNLSDIMSFTDKEYLVTKRTGSIVYGPETRANCERYLEDNTSSAVANELQIKQVIH